MFGWVFLICSVLLIYQFIELPFVCHFLAPLVTFSVCTHSIIHLSVVISRDVGCGSIDGRCGRCGCCGGGAVGRLLCGWVLLRNSESETGKAERKGDPRSLGSGYAIGRRQWLAVSLWMAARWSHCGATRVCGSVAGWPRIPNRYARILCMIAEKKRGNGCTALLFAGVPLFWPDGTVELWNGGTVRRWVDSEWGTGTAVT